MRINVKKSETPLPVRATLKSAAYDVVAISDPEIVGEQYPDGGWKRIDYIQYNTGLITAPQNDSYGHSYHILIHPRSSVSKYNLLLANSIGLVDNDYRNNILVRYKYVWQPEDLSCGGEKPSFVIFGNVNMDKIYKKGDKVAQLISEPTIDADWVYVEDVDITERTGGFGSTDQIIPVTNRETAEITNIPIEKTYESKTNLIEQWKKSGGTPGSRISYESMIREREKQLNQ